MQLPGSSEEGMTHFAWEGEGSFKEVVELECSLKGAGFHFLS